jgi:hypothetical protein
MNEPTRLLCRVMMVVVILVTLAISASSQQPSIMGGWSTTAGYCVQFAKDGKWTVSEKGKTELVDFGNYTFDGKLLTLHSDAKAANCAGTTGQYEISLTADGITYKPVKEECPARGNDLNKGPYHRCSP